MRSKYARYASGLGGGGAGSASSGGTSSRSPRRTTAAALNGCSPCQGGLQASSSHSTSGARSVTQGLLFRMTNHLPRAD